MGGWRSLFARGSLGFGADCSHAGRLSAHDDRSYRGARSATGGRPRCANLEHRQPLLSGARHLLGNPLLLPLSGQGVRGFSNAGGGTLSAKLVGIPKQTDCAPDNAATAAQPGLPLRVNPYPPPTAVPATALDVPGTGRWAWDATNKRHYIVMACPGGWCEIYHDALTAEAAGDQVSADAAGPHNFGPWIDVQPLAVSEGANLKPLPAVVGTGVPAKWRRRRHDVWDLQEGLANSWLPLCDPLRTTAGTAPS